MKYLESLTVAALALFAPIQAAVITVMALVLADLIIGLVAAYKRKEPISSAGIRRTVTKIFVYEGTIMLAFITQKYLIGDIIPATKLITGLIGAVELKSILESMDEINGTSVFGSIIKQLGSKNDDV